MANATWRKHPTSGDFNVPVNWTPAAVPTDTAFFATSKTTHLFFSTNTVVGGLTFKHDASHYTLDISLGEHLTVDSGGVVIKGGRASFINQGTFTLQSATSAISSAGKAHITMMAPRCSS